MSVTPLGPGAEFDIIRRILEGGVSAPRSPVAVAAGDDCALIQSDGSHLAVSVDLSIEGIHFLPDWGTPELFGARAVRVALSDLAAVAAEPVGVLMALSVPAGAGAEMAEAIGRGGREAAEAMGTALIGGDVARGGERIVMDVAALGAAQRPLLRGGVRPGDGLCVTGQLGAAAAAVKAWKAGTAPRPEWRERFWRPEPRIREARWLVDHGAAAGIDLSDGLLADAGHLSAASSVGIELDWDSVPAAPHVDHELTLIGGEDYELLVALPSDILAPELSSEFESVFGIPLTRVGRAVTGIGVRVFRDGREQKLGRAGFDHFATDKN